MKNMGEKLGIRPVAVFSRPDGTVSVMLDCDGLGQVLIKVVREESGKLDGDIVNSDEVNWASTGSFESYVALKVRVRQAGVKAVKHCLALFDEWVVIGQEDEFDIWALKRNLPADILEKSSSYKTRFPLFAI